MKKHKNVFQNEKYSNDATEAIMDNIKKKIRYKEQMCIWGSNSKFFSWENSLDSVQTQQKDLPEKVLKCKNEIISQSTQTIPKGDGNDHHRRMGIPHNYEDERRSPKSFSVNEDMNLSSVELKNDQTNKDYSKMLQKTIQYGMLSMEPEDRDRPVAHKESKDEFSDWCQKRQKEFSFKTNSKFLSESKEFYKRPTMKRNRPKSKSPVPETRKSLSSVDARHTQKYSKSMSQQDISRKGIKTQVCIKVMDERNKRSQEFTVDILDISRIKRNFPKLKEVLPEVDAGNKTVQFSMETINFILRFIFFRRYDKDAMPIATIGVEILAAVKAWEIKEVQHMFLKDFVQKTLPSSNVNLVFSQASYYGLSDVCDSCKDIAADGISLTSSTYQRKQKICFIKISTYIEPLEFPIPFHPIKENFELSFERHICNTLRFEALSGSFILIGIHLQLNDSYLERCSNINTLEIDYTTKNISEDREIEMGRCEKPLRQINVIYFSKHLVVKLNQTVEITVETDTKPYLCSAFPKDGKLKKRDTDGEFHLTIDSDFKLSKSCQNLCIIGKLLYNVPELPK